MAADVSDFADASAQYDNAPCEQEYDGRADGCGEVRVDVFDADFGENCRQGGEQG